MDKDLFHLISSTPKNKKPPELQNVRQKRSTHISSCKKGYWLQGKDKKENALENRAPVKIYAMDGNISQYCNACFFAATIAPMFWVDRLV